MKTTHRHRTIHFALLVALFCGLAEFHSRAQFNSGSTETNGAMNITTNTTLALPPHGQFHCTTINIASNATLRFSNNILNTPVYLLASGDVSINGTIDVSGSTGTSSFGGAGGPGGFAGGNPGISGSPAGDGHGPGAGRAGTSNSSQNSTNHAGHAAYGGAAYGLTAANGTNYGSPLLVPLVGGSGGGGRPSRGGTGGGGAILIASSTSIAVGGSIAARGGDWASDDASGFGSGGAIRLVSPVISGNGKLDATGSLITSSGYSGVGRIRFDCIDRGSLAFNYANLSGLSASVSLGTYMVVFPFAANPPRLDITQVAGNNIPVGTNTQMFFFLPPNSPTNQTVIVQASNFGAVVPIRVVLTPDNGPGSSYDAQIDNSTMNPASTTVNVVVPVNVRVQVNAWTH